MKRRKKKEGVILLSKYRWRALRIGAFKKRGRAMSLCELPISGDGEKCNCDRGGRSRANLDLFWSQSGRFLLVSIWHQSGGRESNYGSRSKNRGKRKICCKKGKEENHGIGRGKTISYLARQRGEYPISLSLGRSISYRIHVRKRESPEKKH